MSVRSRCISFCPTSPSSDSSSMNPAPRKSSTVIPLTLRHADQHRPTRVGTHARCFLVLFRVILVSVLHLWFPFPFPFCPASALNRLFDSLVFLSRLDRFPESSARGELACRLGRFAHRDRSKTTQPRYIRKVSSTPSCLQTISSQRMHNSSHAYATLK